MKNLIKKLNRWVVGALCLSASAASYSQVGSVDLELAYENNEYVVWMNILEDIGLGAGKINLGASQISIVTPRVDGNDWNLNILAGSSTTTNPANFEGKWVPNTKWDKDNTPDQGVDYFAFGTTGGAFVEGTDNTADSRIKLFTFSTGRECENGVRLFINDSDANSTVLNGPDFKNAVATGIFGASAYNANTNPDGVQCDSGLQLVKEGSIAEGPAMAGDTLTYTFLVTNTGNVTVTDITITDAKIGVSNLAVSPSSLAPNQTGTATAVYNISQDDLNSGVLTNSATVEGKDPQGTNVTDTSSTVDNPSGDSETVTTLTQTAELEFVKSGVVEGQGREGETITYTFLVTNTGNITVNNITISDSKLGITDLAISPSTLKPGETGTATAVYAISSTDVEAGEVSNSAIATGTDPAGNNVTDTSSNVDNPTKDSETITNLPPQAVDDTQTTTAGVPVVINIVDNDIAPNGPVTAAIVTPSGIGTTTVSVVDGKPVVTYDAPAGTTGTVSFTYVITDANGLTSTATVVVSLSNPLDAVNDTASVTTGSSVTVSVLNNDDYPVGLTTEGVTIVNVDGLGTATVTDDNKIVYEAPLNQTTAVTIIYNICDTEGQCDTATVTLAVTAVQVFIKVNLLGSMINNENGLMRDDLREKGYIPETTPYLDSTNFGSFVSKGLSQGGETATSDAFDDRGSNSVVDWVFVQFRDSSNSSVVKETRSAFVQKDGDVVDVDGVSPLRYPGSYASDSYYISVRHRNHIGAMSAQAIEFTTTTTFDFTVDSSSGGKFYNSQEIYEGAEQVFFGNVYSLWAGNGNGDEKIKYQGASTDVNRISGEVRTENGNPSQLYNYDNAVGYYNGDYNMDGKAKYQGEDVDTNVVLGVMLNFYPLNLEAKQFNYDLAREQLPSQN